MNQAYKLLTILLFFFVCISNGNAQTLSKGSGTELDPYLIESESDWNTFANDVNGGYDYSGKYIKLTEDISVSTMVGASSHPYSVGVIYPFAGTFDGGDNTINVDIKDVEDPYVAPFRFLNGATIKNLKIIGNVNAATYKQASSLVGRTSPGTVKIINCHCSAIIQGSAIDNGYGFHGGMVGEANGTIIFTNCVFDGKINAPEVHSCGGLLGWVTSSGTTFNNCLMAGTINCGTTNTGIFYGFQSSYSATLTGCYYVETVGKAQGTKALAAPSETGFSKTITFYDDQACYWHGTSSFDITTLKVIDDNNVSLAYTVKYDGSTLTKGTDYEEIITDGKGNKVNEVSPLGKYILTVKGKVINNVGYYGTYETELTEPYVVVEDGGTTLAFKYGVKPEGAYSLNDDETWLPSWSSKSRNITKVVFDKSFKDARPITCRSWFDGFENLTEIVGMKEYLNTERVTNMVAMFSNCKKLSVIDVSGFKTEKVTNMFWMFRDCENLTALDLSGFKTDIVTDMSVMFCNCQKLTTLDLSAFNTENVESMGFMFAGCSNLTTILVSENWKTDEVETDEYMFNNCPELIGNYGATVGDIVGKTKAHAGKDGYLTEGDYKIFYKWADDETGKYYAYTPSAFTFNTTNSVKINNPDDRVGHTFAYWTGTKITGLIDGVTSSDVTIAATEVGNRIYTAHWTINKYAANFYYNGNSSSISVTYTSTLTPIDNPVKPNHKFLHWALTIGGEKVDFETFTMPADDVNFYAQYEEKLDPPVITAVDGLVYNGSEQNLVTVSGDGQDEMTIMYKVDGGSYGADFPIGLDARDYVVWYKADESENYKSIEETSLTATISPWNVTPEITLSETEFIYDGTHKTPTLTSVTYDGIDLNGEYSEPIYQNNVNVGTATVTVSNKSGSNYNFSNTTDFLIKPIPFEFVTGQRAEIKIPISNTGLNFSTDNPQISVVLRDGGYFITTTKNVKKDDLAHIKSEIADITVTVTDPFENFFDEEKWYTEDVVLSYKANDYEWSLSVPDYENFTIAAEGKNDVKCLIYDKLQNIIALKNFEVKIDKTAPELSAKAKNYEIALNENTAKNYFLHSGYDVTVDAKDNVSGAASIQYSWNGSAFSDYNGGITIPYGNNTLSLRATDIAGNVSKIYKAKFSVFEDSKFTLNGEDEITSDTIFYTAKNFSDMSFSVDLNGNTIGAITDKNNNVVDSDVEDNVIKINKKYLETLLPGTTQLFVHVNPLGNSEAWLGSKASDYEAQVMTINLDVKYFVKPTDDYSFVLSTDENIKAFCQGDNVVMNMHFDEKYSDADYISIETLGIDKANPDNEINFRVPIDALKGGNEQMTIRYYKNGYEFDGSILFPSDYPSERNIKVYDDVLAVNNFDSQFVSDGYKWYMDNNEISGATSQYLDLTKYMSHDREHVFYVSVLNIEGDRFRVCPDDEFIITPLSKKAAASVKTYPNPATSGQEVYVVLKNFSEDNFSDAKILFYNQLGGLAKTVSDVKETNPVVLPKGFYNGVVVVREQKVLNFKVVVE
ncbi:MAG: BspA family leucine-rich repeat surface protein [Bacteroidales bacterium]|nr:BspA family leucine-rich repeat surface protein [Bacteroidales bacterium]